MISCPHCSTNNRSNAKFCIVCGHSLLMEQPATPALTSQQCAQCGMLLDPSASFCISCGTPRSWANAAAPVSVQDVSSEPILKPSTLPNRVIRDSVGGNSSEQLPSSTLSASADDLVDLLANTPDHSLTCHACGVVVNFCPTCGAPFTKAANGQAAPSIPARPSLPNK